MVYTAQDLRDFSNRELGDVNYLVASKRQPRRHYRSESGEIKIQETSGGLTRALEPPVRYSNGVWVASADTEADFEVVQADNSVMVPSRDPKYKLLRLWLRGRGDFPNRYLWFNFHNVPGITPRFNARMFTDYLFDNRQYSISIDHEALRAEKAGKRTLADIQDYHLLLVGQDLEWLNPDVFKMLFIHTPWPTADEYCEMPEPARYKIAKDMLAFDILGFQTEKDSENFMNTIEKTVKCARTKDDGRITVNGHLALVRSYPIGIDYDEIKARVADRERMEKETRRIKKRLGIKENQKVFIRWDRADPSKNIPNSIRAYESFLDSNPQHIGNVCYLVIAEESRQHLKVYRDYNREIRDTVEKVNQKYGSELYKPVILTGGIPHDKLHPYWYMFDIHIANSWRDGQHLGVKEGVAANKGNGVSIIGNEVGAAKQGYCNGKGALITDPRSGDAIQELADLMKKAIEMPEAEKEARMANMKKVFEADNIFKWEAERLEDALNLMKR